MLVGILPLLGLSTPTTMLAARASTIKPCTAATNFDCIKLVNISVPSPGPHEAIVRVNVSSVNPSDVDVEENLGRLFGTLGVDVAGVVVEKGEKCDNLEIGDKVWSYTKGAYAQYAFVICAITGKLGDVEPRDIGTLGEVGTTSSQALRKTGAPWDAAKNLTVVITSGSGGTGFVGIQLAKAYGAGKIITACSAANIPFVKSLGADVAVDYHQRYPRVIRTRNLLTLLPSP